MAGILAIGDSFTAPTNPADGWATWPAILGQRLSLCVENVAVPGSGFLAQGIGQWPARFSRQLLTAEMADPSLVIIFGSVNDQNADKNLLRTVSWQTYDAALRRYPDAKHLWIGPQWSGPNARPQGVTDARNAVLDSVWGLPFQTWMDPLDQNWFPASHPEWWTTDKFHPDAAGQQHIADLIEPPARSALGL